MTARQPLILVINPGSTTTKIAMFAGRRCRFDLNIQHNSGQLAKLGSVIDQGSFRREAIVRALNEHRVKLTDIDVFIGRGGLLRPLPEGIYKVNKRMLKDLRTCRYGQHASNLGAILTSQLAAAVGKDAFVANPVVVDELSDIARLSGCPELPRRSLFHALSHKAAARKVAAKLGKPYAKCNLIVAHIGGGVTVGAHCRGRVVDVNNGLDGEGPFTPERTGSLPLLAFFQHATEKQMTARQVYEKVTRNGGLLAHLGTNDCRIIEKKARAGNAKFALVYDAFIYGICKQIGAMAAALNGKVDAVVLTGGVANNPSFVRKIRKSIGFIAPVHVVRKNSEMAALATAALELYIGNQKMSEY